MPSNYSNYMLIYNFSKFARLKKSDTYNYNIIEYCKLSFITKSVEYRLNVQQYVIGYGSIIRQNKVINCRGLGD